MSENKKKVLKEAVLALAGYTRFESDYYSNWCVFCNCLDIFSHFM